MQSKTPDVMVGKTCTKRRIVAISLETCRTKFFDSIQDAAAYLKTAAPIVYKVAKFNETNEDTPHVAKDHYVFFFDDKKYIAWQKYMNELN